MGSKKDSKTDIQHQEHQAPVAGDDVALDLFGKGEHEHEQTRSIPWPSGGWSSRCASAGGRPSWAWPAPLAACWASASATSTAPCTRGSTSLSLTANIAGATKRTAVNALFFIAYCVGNIVSPFSFKDKEAPRYISGIICVLVAFCCEIALLIAFGLYAVFLNRQKAEVLAHMQADNTADEQGRALASFSDLTDKENPYFDYTY